MEVTGFSRIILTLSMLIAVQAKVSYSPAFYRVARPDLYRKCPSPRCGGVFLQKLNVARGEYYVASIDLSLLDTDVSSTVDNYTLKFGTDLVVYRGKLAPLLIDGINSGVNKLIVTTAYLGLPGANVTTDVKGLAFYSATGGGPSLWVRPLNIQSPLLALNGTTSNLVVEPSYNLDLTWQRNQILKAGALLTAPRVRWGKRATGKPLAFRAHEVFIRLPVTFGLANGMCLLNELLCDSTKGWFKVYTRLPNLCFVPSCRNVPGACNFMLPVCADGYRLACWPAPPFACGGFACDPEFAPVASKTC